MITFLNKKYRRVCILGNQHGLLQYLMLSSLEDIKQTFFLWNYIGIPDSVIKKFGDSGTYIPRHDMFLMRMANRFRGKSSLIDNIIGGFLLFFFYRIYYPVRYPFILNSKLEYWGHDHIFNVHCFLRNHPFHLLEDGVFNYGPFTMHQPKQSCLGIKKILGGRNYGVYKKYAGDESNCIDINLTGSSDKGDALKDPKVKIKSFVDMWDEADKEKRSFINNVFDISQSLIDECQNFKHILLTSSYSEENYISEEEKIDMYKKVINQIGVNDIIIKPHPREITDYSKFFPNCFVLKNKAPMQLLSLNGLKFEYAYSIHDSSALYDFPYKIKVCILGSEFYPALYIKIPECKSDNVEINNKNVELIKYQPCQKKKN